MTDPDEGIFTTEQILELFPELRDDFGCKGGGGHAWRTRLAGRVMMRICPSCQRVQLLERWDQ